MKKIFTISFLLLVVLNLSAQTNLRQGRVIQNAANRANISTDTSHPVNPHSTINDKKTKFGNAVVTKDTIYCTCTKKQHGWFTPMDTVSKEMTLHIPYYRFTNKNKAGHWLKMERFNAYGNRLKGEISPYILNLRSAESDKDANSEWVEKLKTSCIWEFVADYTGENIVQERAYDENMKIVFTYSRVYIGNNQYIGSYKDCFGLPAEMRDDKDYTYGTLVRITEDRWGNDSVIQYIDAKGVPKLNSDGVAMKVYIHDKQGHLLKHQSRNMDGSLAIDNWGNCGMELVWDKDHNIISATYMDDSWTPMRMPAIREIAENQDVFTANYRYDKYKRQTEVYFTDTLGQSDTNAFGTHRIKYDYDQKGNLIKQCGYDKMGNLSPIDNSGSCIDEIELDEKGRTINICFFDKYGKPNPKDGYLSRVHWEYDDNDNEVLVERYSAETGIEKLCSKEEKTKHYNYYLWNNGLSTIDSLDSKGRITFIGFYGVDGNLEMTYGRAYERYSYLDDGKTTTQTETHYDANGNMVDIDGICKTITLVDSTNWTKTVWKYDKNDDLVETYIHQYDNSFNRLLSQDDTNTFGVLSRSGGSAGTRYYKGAIIYSQKGKFASLLGRDEFGEADYITSNYITYYYSKLFRNSGTIYYDEDNNEIENEKELRDKLPKVMTIEVVDSSAYDLGLRDNDVILLYGDYSIDIEALDSVSISYYQFRRDWSLHSILDAPKNKRMVVFRINNAQKNRYSIVEIKNLAGLPSELGFLPHIRYLTKKQLARIKDAVKSEISSNNPIITKKDLYKSFDEGDNYIIMSFNDMFRFERNKPYAKQVIDPTILLGACIKNKNMYWEMTKGEDTEEFEEMLNSRKENAVKYPTMHLYLTKDMQSITDITLADRAIQTNWFDTRISDEDYARLLKINTKVQYEMEHIRNEPSIINSKKLYGVWQIVKNADEEYAPNGYLYLSKDGTCQGCISSYGTITFDEGDAVFLLEKDYTGKWSHNDSLISLFPIFADSIRLSCVDILGSEDEDLKHRAIDFLNSSWDKESLLNRMDYKYLQWDTDLFINSLDNKTLTILGNGDKVITFMKEKGKFIPESQKVSLIDNKKRKKSR